MEQSVPALEDAGALDDPIAIEAESLIEMIVGDDGVGHVAARRQDAHTGERATGWTRRSPFVFESVPVRHFQYLIEALVQATDKIRKEGKLGYAET